MSETLAGKAKKMTKEQSLENLRSWYPKGSTVYTILRHVSKSGMRTIGLVSIACDGDGKPDLRYPNYATATVLELPEDRKRDGVKVRGCGMDMGFSIAYDLATALYGDGYALKHQWL